GAVRVVLCCWQRILRLSVYQSRVLVQCPFARSIVVVECVCGGPPPLPLAHAISLSPVLPNLAPVVGLPSEPPSSRCPPLPPSRPPSRPLVLSALLHACCDLRLIVIPTLRAHSPAPANQPAMPPST
ncbi:hypothetical protein ACJX0J_017991, partial [Zea mays]